jgi:hypothetical protein
VGSGTGAGETCAAAATGAAALGAPLLDADVLDAEALDAALCYVAGVVAPAGGGVQAARSMFIAHDRISTASLDMGLLLEWMAVTGICIVSGGSPRPYSRGPSQRVCHVTIRGHPAIGEPRSCRELSSWTPLSRGWTFSWTTRRVRLPWRARRYRRRRSTKMASPAATVRIASGAQDLSPSHSAPFAPTHGHLSARGQEAIARAIAVAVGEPGAS